MSGHSGPLKGVRVIELGGIGPAPYGTMLLADLGADVIRVDRPDPWTALATDETKDIFGRGKRSITADLKSDDGRTVVEDLVNSADVLVDPFRPGVLERLGFEPERCLARNPGLVVARMTGWGQDGPLAHAAGHDLNYIALAGALHHMGVQDQPPPVPLNLVGDFGGGGMLLAFGVVSALFERTRSGAGQVIDVAIVDGVASLLGSIFSLTSMGQWNNDRNTNWLDGSAPWYRAYRCADGEWITVGALEPQFYGQLLKLLEVDPERWKQWETSDWPALHNLLESVFRQQTSAHWRMLLEGTDVCFAPAMRIDRAIDHPHLAARGTYVVHNGVRQPAPVPRFSRTPGAIGGHPPRNGEHTDQIRSELERADMERIGAYRKELP